MGGYELRNKYFKGCNSKDITIYQPESANQEKKRNTEACLVFEGFIDYLSYLTLKKIDRPIVDTIILNSVSNLDKAIEFIKIYPKVYTYLDNDEAGRRATKFLSKVCHILIDKSTKYARLKDLNEYLCKTQSKQNIQQTMRIDKPKGLRR